MKSYLNPFPRLFVTRIRTSQYIILHSTGHLVCFKPGVDRKLSVQSIAVFLFLSLLNAFPIDGKVTSKAHPITDHEDPDGE
jgi:hypothetical protein